MRKPVARGVVATGFLKCSPRSYKASTRRGSHRPVQATLSPDSGPDNGPDGPSLQCGGMGPGRGENPRTRASRAPAPYHRLARHDNPDCVDRFRPHRLRARVGERGGRRWRARGRARRRCHRRRARGPGAEAGREPASPERRRRERRSVLRAAERPPSCRAGTERRAGARARAPTARRRGRWRSCRRTRPTATSTTGSATCCAAQRCTASTPVSSASRFRRTSVLPAGRSASAVRLRRPTTRARRRGPESGVRRVHGCDRGADAVERRRARRARRRTTAVAAVRRSRDRHPRGVCGPGVARTAQRGDVHEQRPAGTHPARLLPHRVGARSVALTRSDAGRRRASCSGGPRRVVVRRTDAARRPADARRIARAARCIRRAARRRNRRRTASRSHAPRCRDA